MKDIRMLRDQVSDERSFVDFLDALSLDWSSHQPPATEHQAVGIARSAAWESNSIGTFLDKAVMAGDESINSLKDYEHPPNHWHRVACILYSGKRYD
jgi:hypothetical protein